jgi:hypothetical protein
MDLTQEENSWRSEVADAENLRFVAYVPQWLEKEKAQGKAKEHIRVS